jgi:hypothetical protein
MIGQVEEQITGPAWNLKTGGLAILSSFDKKLCSLMYLNVRIYLLRVKTERKMKAYKPCSPSTPEIRLVSHVRLY